MANSSDYRLGSIWLVTFDPSKGTEIRKTRPALIVSGTLFNQRRSKVTVLPFTDCTSRVVMSKLGLISNPNNCTHLSCSLQATVFSPFSLLNSLNLMVIQTDLILAF
jgi:hypothetical protein